MLTSGNAHIIGSGDNRFCQHIVADGTRWFRRGKKKNVSGENECRSYRKNKTPTAALGFALLHFLQVKQLPSAVRAEGFGFRHLVHIECLAVINDFEERDGEGLQRTT